MSVPRSAQHASFSLVAVPRPAPGDNDAWTTHGINTAGQSFTQAGVTVLDQVIRVEVSGDDMLLAIDELERRLKHGLGQVMSLRAAARHVTHR